MYSVVYINREKNASLQVTLFRSALVDECWSFVRRRLEHPNKLVRRNAINLFVLDDADNFCTAPEDINTLCNYNRAS